MPEWLREAALTSTPLSAGTMILRLLAAAVFGAIIAGVYRFSHGRLARDSRTLIGTLVLLTILLAMVTMVIGESVARAFGLVGALSIVRFRTVVEDTRDTAFVIFAVVVGMAVGTGLWLVAALGVPVVAVAALSLTGRGREGASDASPIGAGRAMLSVRMGVGHASGAIDELLTRRTRTWRLTGVATARQGAALDYLYSLDLSDDKALAALVGELNALTGVQGVDLKRDGAGVDDD